MTDRLTAMSSTATGRATVGDAAGQPKLGGRGGDRALGNGGSVLPELTEAPERVRRWWLQPAFIVSVCLTFLALAALAAWLIVSALTDSNVKVSALSASTESGNLRLDWSGPEADYALFAVSGDGTASDLTGFVTGTEAWLPAAAGLYDDRTCFVVRPAGDQGEVSLDAGTVAGQKGASICAADAAS
ncbi:hypothetical protein [Agromyces laixinhei]|uniref:hypothetical protein n=1 Tax=Agromyces laixinhei TaxID=2585717 RepID=UPI001115C2FD|nr:hypothetical protein [Agromyces laixinhei]